MDAFFRKKRILTHLFLQRVQYFRPQIPRALHGGEEQRTKVIQSLSSQSERVFNAIHCISIGLTKSSA